MLIERKKVLSLGVHGSPHPGAVLHMAPLNAAFAKGCFGNGLRRPVWCVAVLALLLQLGPPVSAHDTSAPSKETELKVAFLYNFALYTQWPLVPDQGLVLCVLGHDDLGTALDAIANRQINNKPILVHRLDAPADISDCHLVYLPGVPDAKSVDATRGLHDRPVLSVTDAATEATEEWAMIRLGRSGNRLVFDINNTSVRAAGLVLSSKLLRLARKVR